MSGNKLLLVEDDLLIQELLESAFTDAGFEVVSAANGTHAIAELSAAHIRFRVVITDIKLGAGPNGWDVGRHGRELVPDMPILYVSGYSGHEWSSKGVPNSVLVAKPFVIAQIITAIVTLLNEADERRATTSGGS